MEQYFVKRLKILEGNRIVSVVGNEIMNIVKDARRIVIKIGSSSLTYENGKLHLHRMEMLARVLSDFKNAGKEIVLVSSGAISAGMGKMGLNHRPQTTEEKQAMAAIGQSELMRMYERFFSLYGQTVGQILLTREVVDNPIAYQNAENTFRTLLTMGCLPIVNENDTISFEEIEFGDNDTLAAQVAILCQADVLINMSDIDGLYDGDPHEKQDAKRIPTVPVIDDTIRSYAGGAGSNRGTGGVITKLHAAEIACAAGIPMFLISGENPEILYDLFEGKCVGTYFMSH